jgi:serine/threonine-protein kinase
MHVMVSSDLGACEWFVWDLRRSGLIDRGQLDQVIGEFLKRNPRAEPPALAEYLVGNGVLSPFQAERILQGKTQGLVLGPYVLVDTVGSGSMGQVFKAQSKTDNQWYAVKVLPRRSMWNVRLARRQVRAFSQFTQPAVVPFMDVGTSGGLHYLVWPLVEGETLENVVNRNGKLSSEQTALIGHQLAQGLTQSHQNGIFHGLLKPSNVMLGKDGQARILDFGIGSLLVENEGESLVDTMSTANTLTSGLDCASPESIMEPTNRTPAGDQYSLGCVLYFCLAGRYPFPDGTAVEKMMSHQFKQPTPLQDVVPGTPQGLIAIVERLMQKAPESRYSGADEIVEALQPFVNDPLSTTANRKSSGSMGGFAPTPNIGRSSFATPTSSPTPVPPIESPRVVQPPVPPPPAPPVFAPAPMPVATPVPPAPAPNRSWLEAKAPAPAPMPSPNPVPPAPKPAPLPTRGSFNNDAGLAPPPMPLNAQLLGQSDPVVPETFGVRSSAMMEEDEITGKSSFSPLFIGVAVMSVVVIVYLLGKQFFG